MYGTGNSAQCYVAIGMGGEFGGRVDTSVYMAESLSCSSETTAMLLITLPIGFTPTQNKKLKKLLGIFWLTLN